jgi:uncharacterized protein (TIGR02466 family)
VVLRSGGYQTPHIHPDGIVSGVYYVRVPDAVRTGTGEAGCIRFGQPSTTDGGAVEGGALLTMTVKPEAGLMVLFPSYFWHRTLPFESPQDRICIAFDVQPDRRRAPSPSTSS